MIFWTRIFVFTLLPLLIAVIHISVSRRAKEQWSEILLLYVLGSTGAGGVGNFFGHLFLSDMVAAEIGWEPGSPFQLEMAFANLSVGILGFGAMRQRDGFRAATAIAVATLGFGATIVHLMDIIATGNLAPGNTIINVSNLSRPILLIALLVLNRRRLVSIPSLAQMDEQWHGRQVELITFIVVFISIGYGVGFSLGFPLLLSIIGALLGFGVGYSLNRRSGDSEYPASV